MSVGDVPDEPPSRPLYAVISPRGLPLPAPPGRGLHFVSRAFSHKRYFDFPLQLTLVAEANAELERLLLQRANRPLGQFRNLSDRRPRL